MEKKIPIFLFCIFLILLISENIFPLRKRNYKFIPRFFLNLIFTGLVFLAGSLIVRNSALTTSQWIVKQGFGITSRVPFPTWGNILLGVLLLDLTFYYWHRLNHTLSLFWRFHNIHHIDPDLDVTTSFRFHFVEIVYSAPFRVVQVLILGISPLTYLIYEALFTCGTMFHHSNVRLPLTIERLLNRVIVTPRMHGVHHSTVRNETNSNYSVIFSWWDRFHKTLVLNVPQLSIKIGVPAYQETKDNRFWALITTPFMKQREYGRDANGSCPSSNQEITLKATRMIA
jgi:sterol desaturase/sphingolipid hydroxylase (fatty acid hydroxylase superfamily)